MKKFVYCFNIIFILIVYFCNNIVQASNAIIATNDNSGIAKFDNCKIVSWMEISNLRLTLPNGHAIAQLETANNMNVSKITKTIDILFILDTSGSMRKNDRLQILKNSTKRLINELRSKFDENNLHKLRLSIIEYSDNVSTLFNFEPCTDDNLSNIYSKIDSLKPHTNTYTGAAIRAAQDLWNSTTNKADFKYTILITDGQPSDEAETQSNLETFKKELPKINFLTILIELIKYDYLYEASDSIIHTKDSNFETELVNGISNFIFWYFVNASSLTIARDKYGIIEGEDFYMATLDNELVYGSVLEIEYNIIIKSTEEIKAIKITDYLPKYFNYNPSSTLLSEDKKNDDYKWTYDSDNNILICKVKPRNVKKDDGTYKDIRIKVILSSLLSSNMDFDYLKNYADITLLTSSNTYTTINAEDPPALFSNSFSIIPPFGGDFGSNRICTAFLSIIIVLSTILLIIKRKLST